MLYTITIILGFTHYTVCYITRVVSFMRKNIIIAYIDLAFMLSFVNVQIDQKLWIYGVWTSISTFSGPSCRNMFISITFSQVNRKRQTI